MDISCAFATSLETPEHIALAERLGYRRAWCYDSPALYADVWMTLARAAERTSVIGLGPGVLIPHLRHVMTNAAAIATLEALAPGRVAVAIGSGFTGRLAMGQRPHSWKAVREYVLTLRALLRGEQADWEGAAMQMLHPAGFAPPRPIEVPIVLGISGPRGLAVAGEVADGIIWLQRQPARRLAALRLGVSDDQRHSAR
jgi:5,10-methylenetetrahydromethanopterin reductase